MRLLLDILNLQPEEKFCARLFFLLQDVILNPSASLFVRLRQQHETIALTALVKQFGMHRV